MSAVIRPVQAGAFARLAAIHARCFDEPWNAAAIGKLLDMPGTFGFMAGDEPAGFVLARAAAGEAEILTIAVDPASRGHGVGQALLAAAAASALAAGATTLFLEVAEDNGAARRLYERFGFRQVGERPGYYARGALRVAGLTLRLDLAPLS